jgi:hypothetical protein
MRELFEFLNGQNGERLVGYSIVFIIVTYLVIEGIVDIVRAITKVKKVKKEIKIE